MSAAAADHLSSPTYTATIQAAASNSSSADGSLGSTAKRGIFGRRRKSSVNLSTVASVGSDSPSSITLASQSSAGSRLPGNDSVESLGTGHGGRGGSSRSSGGPSAGNAGTSAGTSAGAGAGDEGASLLKKGVKNVFKRKPRAENPSSPRGSIASIEAGPAAAAPDPVVAGDQAVVDDDGEGSLGASDGSDSPT